MDYVNTFIAVADDCEVTAGEVPATRRAKPTVAMIQYAMLADHPYQLTQDDVLFTTWLKQRELAGDDMGSELATLRQQFFSIPKAYLRASPLPKKHGWGLRFDDQGRVALCPMESPEYQDAVAGRLAGTTVVKAMRSSKSRPADRSAPGARATSSGNDDDDVANPREPDGGTQPSHNPSPSPPPPTEPDQQPPQEQHASEGVTSFLLR